MVRVTKQKIEGVNKRVKENIQEAKEFLETMRNGDSYSNVEDAATVRKLKLERNLEKLTTLTNAMEEQEDGESVEDYEETQFNAEDVIAELQVMISKREKIHHLEQKEKEKRLEAEIEKEKMKLEMEQREKQRQFEADEQEKQRQSEADEREKQRQSEADEREKQRKFELEKLTLETQMNERKLQREIDEQEKERQMRIELEQLKLNTEEKLQQEKMNVEKMKIETKEKMEADQSIKTKTAIRLPKLELKKFDGDILKWQEFWDTYESTIHNNPSLEKVDKFKYLKCQLIGRSIDALAGLDITNNNYDTAIEMLQERYGKLDIIVNAHYAKLTNMQPPSYKTISLRVFYDTAEKHIRALDSLGQDVNHQQLMVTIKSKLPQSVLERLEERRDRKEAWTMENLRKALRDYIDMKEETAYQARLFQSPDEDNFRRRPGASSYPTNLRHSTGEVLFSNERKSERRRNKCIFCDGDHWSDECKTFTTIPARKEKIKGRCFICFKPTHQSKNCINAKTCYHCGENKKHHRSLCPQKFSTTSNTLSQRDKSDTKETGLISLGEKVVMQTALVQASNPNDATCMETRLLLDTGSQRSYITKELSKTYKKLAKRH